MDGTRLMFGKSFVRKQYTSWYFGIFIVSAKSVEVPRELSEDCYWAIPPMDDTELGT